MSQKIYNVVATVLALDIDGDDADSTFLVKSFKNKNDAQNFIDQQKNRSRESLQTKFGHEDGNYLSWDIMFTIEKTELV